MNFAKFQKLVEERSGFRTMEQPMATGEYFSDSCGDMYSYYLQVGPNERIADVSYFTTGCGFGTATCSLLVELARGKTLDEAYAIDDAQIEAQLDGYPEKKKDYPSRSIAALRAAIDDFRAKRAAGKITDEMLARASALAPAAPEPAPSAEVVAASTNGAPVDDGKMLIKLH
ncbi:MAG: iron-sulfur cluster assembly scaffold protein [Vulcanimicrobiaceae bacterium]